jgi:hypothetical protein
MSNYILFFSFDSIIENGINCFKYLYNKITNLHYLYIKPAKIDWLINKVSFLENEVNELHETIHNLEVQNEKVKTKLNEKLDFLTRATYDIIEN